jgi:FKBP-type peptidyl-prolyl cis-trans isomerase
MKHSFNLIFLTAFLCAVILAGCGGTGKTESGSAPAEGGIDKDASYALGMNLGSNLKENGVIPDSEEFFKGFKDAIGGEKTRFTAQEAEMRIQQAFMAQQEKQNSELAQKENEFLAETSKKPGINITGSGLMYEVISEGSGPKPAATDTVRVNYEGKLSDGTVFDSSYARGQPVEFPLNGVIPGWTEGVQLMNTGSKYRLYIPSALGYGDSGTGPIPPHSPLVFEVELIDIIK